MSLLEAYPDFEYLQLKESLADYYQIQPQQITVGNGGEDIINNLLYVLEGDIIIIEPTFSEYRVAAQKFKKRVMGYPLRRDQQFTLNVNDLLDWLDHRQITQASLFLCRPNNPTGVLYPLAQMKDLAKELEKRKIRLVLDESFIDFTGEAAMMSYLEDFPHLLLIQSLTKFYAMPGLRLGFGASADLSLIQKLEEQRADWTVNAFADLCGRHLHLLEDYRRQTLSYIKAERQRLKEEIIGLNQVSLISGSANFLFLQSHQPGFYDFMLEHGLVVRSCSNFHGLSNFDFRIAVRCHDENSRLIQALKEYDQL